jgi:hypothetical protein
MQRGHPSAKWHFAARDACERVTNSLDSHGISASCSTVIPAWDDITSSFTQPVIHWNELSKERNRFALDAHLHSIDISSIKLAQALSIISSNVKAYAPEQRYGILRQSVYSLPKQWLTTRLLSSSVTDYQYEEDCKQLQLLIIEDVTSSQHGIHKLIQFCRDPDDVVAIAEVIRLRTELVRSNGVMLPMLRNIYLDAMDIDLLRAFPRFAFMIHIASRLGDYTDAPDPWLVQENLHSLIAEAESMSMIDVLFLTLDTEHRLIGLLLILLLESDAVSLYVALEFVDSVFGIDLRLSPIRSGFRELRNLVLPS